MSVNVEGPLAALSYAVGTDVGRRRDENQDSYGYIEKDNAKFYIVADGMGGAQGGAIASTTAVKVVEQELNGVTELGVQNLSEAIKKANADIYEMGQADENLSGMGTTFVGLAFVGTTCVVINVGDSRAYRIRSGSVYQLTSDHTLVNELVKTGAINADQVENHPVAHMLTRSLGPTPDVEVDCWVSEDGPARGDTYLLCSDGLYNLVEDREMLELVRENPLDKAVTKLIDLANERGGTDNITVMLVKIGEEFPLSVEDFAIPAVEDQDIRAVVEEPSEPLEANGLNGAAAEEEPVETKVEDEWKRPEDLDEIEIAEPVVVEDSQRSEPESAEPIPSGSSWHRWAIAGVVGVFLIFLGTQLDRFSGAPKDRTPPVPIFNPLSAVIAASEVSFEVDSAAFDRAAGALPRIFPVGSDGQEIRESVDLPPSQFDRPGTLTGSQRASLEVRVNRLKKDLASYDRKIAAFDQPLSGTLMAELSASESSIAQKRKDFEKTSVELDQASRRLSVWYGRGQRIAQADPVDIASEVAVVSESVKQKKELFERATWAYLQEVESWRFNPSDQKLSKSVAKLGRAREQRRRELESEVRRVIDENKNLSEREIAAVTEKRDKIQVEIDALVSEVEFIKALTSNDPLRRQAMLEHLKSEQALAKEELGDLEKLLKNMK